MGSVFPSVWRALRSPMARFIARRLVWMLVLLVVVSFVAFVIFYALPSGDPAAARAGRGADEATIERVRHELNLDGSLLSQFGHYMERIVFHGDFGYSYFDSSDVRKAILSRLPATISLAVGAAILWLVVGVAIGIVAAVRPRSWFDRIAMGGALLGISAPVYWLGLVVLVLFAQGYGVVHVIPQSGSYQGLTEDPWAWFTSLLAPWFVLATSFAAIYARLMRANLREVMGEDYIRTAEAKGLSRRRVVFVHGVRAAGTPVVTAFGLDLGILLGGAVLTETVFNIPGIGRLAYVSILNSDLAMIQGTVLFAAMFIIVANLVVDLLYAFIDPRVTLT